MQYRKDRKGNELSILGYGCMRFTGHNGKIDEEKAEQEIMEAYRAGVNYYDTAYIYPGSEVALGNILRKNQIRDKVNIATKLPQYLISSQKKIDEYFAEELRRLQTDHVDYYHNHHRQYPLLQLWGYSGGLGNVSQHLNCILVCCIKKI